MTSRLDTITLAKGMHTAEECADGQRCLFEAYNWLTRQRNTDERPAAWAAAGDAARDAARAVIAPTVTLLQDSAITLYDQTIGGEWPA